MVHIQANMFICTKCSINKKYLPIEKSYSWQWPSLLISIKAYYKRQVGCFAGLFHPLDKHKEVMLMSKFASQHKRVIKETSSKVGRFAGFCLHCVITI